MEDWAAELQQGRPEAAWDLFIGRYRRLIFAAIRHYAQDYDDVMDVFARVCEALRADDLRRLRDYVQQSEHRARFSTWLVTVVRHITVDWFRHRDGRRRLSTVAYGLPALRRRIFERAFRRVTLAVLALFTTTGAAGQQVTGDIQGRMVAPGGQPLADVQVSVAGPSLQGGRQTLSDARGRFLLPSLPTGLYAVALRRIGYGPVRFQNVPVRLGSTTSLGDIQLEPQAVEVAEVIVSGARPVIDPVSPATGTSLDSSQFVSLPSARDFRALLAFVPQANASPFSFSDPILDDGVNIAGSTGLENAFYVDGMNVAVLNGHSFDLPFNFVREIKVATGGYEAEYGRALSGVISVVTPSGGNEFHGQALGFFSADELRTVPRVGVGEVDPVNFTQYDLGLSLSGPLQRDRLWYFVAYNPTSSRQDVVLAALPRQRGSERRHLFAGKLTWKAGGTDVALTVLGDPYTADRFAPEFLPSTTDPRAVLTRESGGGTTTAVATRHEIDSRTQLSAAVSRLDRRADYGPRSGSTSLQAITRLDDYTDGSSLGGVGVFEKTTESRTAVRVALTLLRSTHAVKLGMEYEDNAYSDSLTLSTISRTPDGVYDWLVNTGFSRVRNRVPTLYAQDTWEVNRRVSVSAGIRWEAQHMTGDVGPARTIASELAPRFGVVYQPGELGSQRLLVSVGRFYQQVPPLALIFWNSGGVWLSRRYPQNPMVDSSNGVVLTRFDFNVPATRDLVGQHYDQFGVGYERRVGSAFKVGVHGTHRVLRWALEDGDPGDGVYRMGNPGRGPLAAMPRARQRYAALEVSVERSSPGPLFLLGSYVLSRNVGNYTGLYATDLMVGLPNSGPQYDVPDLMINADGLLPNDRAHVAKAAASYRLGFGATFGGFLTVASGTPLSEYGTSAYGFPYWTFVRPRGSASRTPATWSLDLHAAYDLPVARDGRVRPRVLLDVFNVGSPRRAQLYDQRHYFDNAQTQLNPDYGSVTRYQPPMSARVGLVVDF